MTNYKIFRITSLLLSAILFILISCNRNQLPPDQDDPAPLEGYEEHIKRERWIEDMHQAAPGVNWKAIDLQTRLNRSSSYAKFQNTRGGSVTIGGIFSGTWNETGSKNQSGRIHVAELDTVNQILYCASSGGQIWRANVGSMQWEVLTDHFMVLGISMLRIVQHNNHQRFIIATGQSSSPGVFYSDDTCKTWMPTQGITTSSWGYLKRAVMASDSLNTIYVLVREWNGAQITRLYKSTDHGANFQIIDEFPQSSYGSINGFDIWTDRYGTAKLYMLHEKNLYQLQQGTLVIQGSLGGSTPTNIRLTGYERNGIATLYAMAIGTSSSQFYKSTDNGVTWSTKGVVNQRPFMINSFECSANDPTKVYFGGVEAYRSFNSATSFHKVNTWQSYYQNVQDSLHADIPGLCSFIDQGGSEVVFICTDGGLYRSDNNMVSFSNLSMENLNVSQYYSVYTGRANTNYVHAGSQDQGYQLSSMASTGVLNFDQVWSGDYGHIVSGDNGQSVWMNYPGFTVIFPDIMYTTTRKTWTFTMSGNLWIPPLMSDPYDPNSVIIAGGGFNGGAHLIQLSYLGQGANMVPYEFPFDFSIGGNAKVSAVASSLIDIDSWYVLTSDGKFFYSSDAGTNWNLMQDFGFSFGHYFYGADILPSPNELGKVYISGSGYSNPPVLKLKQHGLTWSAMDTDLPNSLVYAIDCTPEEGLIFAATEVGPFVYISEQEKWFDLSTGMAPDQRYWTLDYIEDLKTVRFGTYGRGLWDFDFCDGQLNNPIASYNWAFGTGSTQVNFTDQSTDAFTYLWIFDDGTTSLKKNPVHYFPGPGTYNVTLVAGNICERDTLTQTINIPVGIDEIKEETVVSIMPNPVKDYCKIFIKNPSGEITFRLYNSEGKEIPLQVEKVTDEYYEIETVSIPKGLFFLSIRSSADLLIKKIIIL